MIKRVELFFISIMDGYTKKAEEQHIMFTVNIGTKKDALLFMSLVNGCILLMELKLIISINNRILK